MCWIPTDMELIKGLQDRLRKNTELLDAIILAYKERGECLAEINNAAFEFGYSLKRTEFKWYDAK
jgi:hypothetical protein